MRFINGEVSVLQTKFWNIVTKFYDLPDNFSGSIPEFAARLKIRLSDGFFYSQILPKLVNYGVLVETGDELNRGYVGRSGKVYRVDKDNLDRMIVKLNLLANKIYKKWIVEGNVELGLL